MKIKILIVAALVVMGGWVYSEKANAARQRATMYLGTYCYNGVPYDVYVWVDSTEVGYPYYFVESNRKNMCI